MVQGVKKRREIQKNRAARFTQGLFDSIPCGEREQRGTRFRVQGKA
jgi:hypothetical protein